MPENVILPTKSIAETERSKKVADINKKEKEKDKAEEGHQFVIDV